MLMGWIFQVKGSWRTPHRSLRGKDNTGEVVPFGEICLGRYHSEDGAKLNVRWMRGVFVGKLDSTDGFILLTPTGATKTRCVRRIEGNSAWDLQFSNFCEQEANAREPEVSPKKRKTCESDINQGGASSLTAATSKRGESEHASNAESSNLLTGRIAAVNKTLCDTPSVDLSHDRTAQNALKAG